MTEPTGDQPGPVPPSAAEPATALAPGWYPDPDDAGRQAFWNGATWKRPAGPGATVETGATPGKSGRPGWVLPVLAVVVVVAIVAVVGFIASTRGKGSSTASAGAGGSQAAAGPQATGPRVGENGVTVVLPDGWTQVPLDDTGFQAFVDEAGTGNPVAADLTKVRQAAGSSLSVIGVVKASDGTYKTDATVLMDKTPVASAAVLADTVEQKLNSTVHDVSVSAGSIGGHDAVFATYDAVSALVPPQGAQVYVLLSSGVAIVTVTSYDVVDPLGLAKQIAATVEAA